MSQKYPWYPAYSAAVLQTDNSKISGLILEAELALGQRAQEPNVDSSELHVIQNALEGLKALSAERTQASSSKDSIAIQPPSVNMGK